MAKKSKRAKSASSNSVVPEQTHATAAEQTRESQESGKALNAEASIRARMIKIGRGNQQAGRQGS